VVSAQIQTATKHSLGLIGAGRLGEAIAKTWIVRTGQAPLVWSRNGSQRENANRITEATWGAEWSSSLAAESLVIAIPGNALIDLAADSEQAKQFTGNVFSAAFSLSRESLRRVFPRATIICISPFLIDGVNSIPMLVLRTPDLSEAKWAEVEAVLQNFGDVDVVEDEETFAQVALLGSSWAAVVLAALQAAANAGVQRVEDEVASRIGKRIFFRAIRALLATQEHESSSDITTPGGITERGLQSLGDITTLFASVFKQMQTRADELRA
jgi:pyrroline-5-carboxylate reductase